MEFRHLVSFLAIAEELHFGRAAARLHLTQPSLSQQLQRLERTLGVELVARTSHEVRLTSAGRAFEVEARAIVSQVDKAAQCAREAAAGRTGTVRVGYNFPAGQHILPMTLAKMHAEFPDVMVRLEEKRTGPQLQALADGELDIALVYGRPVTSDFQYRRLLRLPMVAVVGQGHKWAGRPGVPFAELAHQPCILFAREQSPAMYDAILSAAERTGIRLNVANVVDDPGATGILVSVKPLVGFASASRGMFAGAAAGGVRPVPVPLYQPVPMVDLYVVWREGEPTRLQTSFLDCLEAVGPFDVPALTRFERAGTQAKTA
ncbi:LysR substrate-binding domain-containing protein [Amycolatopsis pithecellobii]|uniref:LysR family transcriptional regulator n=1 Tax=Amycolatopsis pithecellobii TaxID=664692 RepID=A0A6N7YYS4_9PSEU|nr:LysR family transcriptional regulator [Amycolatopsis pithecellobii]MTD58235.1 LysR family transcriptional regulator [Amycolatopsis pithecellobii]